MAMVTLPDLKSSSRAHAAMAQVTLAAPPGRNPLPLPKAGMESHSGKLSKPLPQVVHPDAQPVAAAAETEQEVAHGPQLLAADADEDLLKGDPGAMLSTIHDSNATAGAGYELWRQAAGDEASHPQLIPQRAPPGDTA